MPISINFNICDNSPECSGMTMCKTGAIFWDKTRENFLGGDGTLCVDNGKCVSCGACVGEEGCPVGAIAFAATEKELAELSKDFAVDMEAVERLFVERYGAEPINESLCVSEDDIPGLLSETGGVVIVERYTDESIQCLLSSIPVDTILQKVRNSLQITDVRYYKCNVSGDVSQELEMPMLCIYKGNARIGEIAGFYGNDQSKLLENKILEILR